MSEEVRAEERDDGTIAARIRRYQEEVNRIAAETHRLQEQLGRDRVTVPLQEDISDAARYAISTGQTWRRDGDIPGVMSIPMPTQDELARAELLSARDEPEESEIDEIMDMFDGLSHVPGERLRDIVDEANELTDEIIETLSKPRPKGPFNKNAFLQSISASDELIAFTQGLDTKEDVLKAVFEYNNRPQKPLKYRQNKKAVDYVKLHNANVEMKYTHALKTFYDETMESFHEGRVGQYISDNEMDIKRGYRIDESIFQHPLFKVVSVKRGQWRRYDDSPTIAITFETRERVIFTHYDRSIDAGPFRFKLLIRTEYSSAGANQTKFYQQSANFRRNAGPYISENNTCTGESGPNLSQNVRQGNIFDYMTELYTVMTRFNTKSNPYVGLDRFFNDVERGALRRRSGEIVRFIGEETKTEEVPL